MTPEIIGPKPQPKEDPRIQTFVDTLSQLCHTLGITEVWIDGKKVVYAETDPTNPENVRFKMPNLKLRMFRLSLPN